MDARVLRELELDVISRLFARGDSDAPVMPASRTELAEAAAGSGSPWLVVAHPDAFAGAAGKLLDAMLAAVGMRRAEGAREEPPAPPALAIVFGDHALPEGVPAVATLDPRYLLEHPADKSRAWEHLAGARRRAAT